MPIADCRDDREHPVHCVQVERPNVFIARRVAHLLVDRALVLLAVEVRTGDKHPRPQMRRYEMPFLLVPFAAISGAKLDPYARQTVQPEYELD